MTETDIEPQRRPQLIAHRGYVAAYPENTLEGIGAAIDQGARWVEFDIQLSADGVPFLLHDPTLDRTTGRPGNVLELNADALREYSPSEPARFGDQFAALRLASVAELSRLLAKHPGVTAFAEIKKHSIERFGSRYTVARVLEALQPVIDQTVVISFVAEAIAQARELGAPKIGWAIRQFSQLVHKEAELLKPHFIFCDYKIIPKPSKKNPNPLWAGPWQWAVYEVGNPGLALHLAGLGADLIETFDIASLAGHPALTPR